MRRCLGASFAQFEMKQVLETVVSEADLAPADPAPERIRRRAITLVPSRESMAVLERRRTRSAAAEPAGGKPAAAMAG